MNLVSALQAVDDAARELPSARQSVDEWHSRLITAVRSAHALGVSQAELGRRTGYHRNTISGWCK